MTHVFDMLIVGDSPHHFYYTTTTSRTVIAQLKVQVIFTWLEMKLSPTITMEEHPYISFWTECSSFSPQFITLFSKTKYHKDRWSANQNLNYQEIWQGQVYSFGFKMSLTNNYLIFLHRKKIRRRKTLSEYKWFFSKLLISLTL